MRTLSRAAIRRKGGGGGGGGGVLRVRVEVARYGGAGGVYYY